MQIQLGNNKYQLEIIDLKNDILNMNTKFNVINSENILFKNNITNLQVDISIKNNIINELTNKMSVLSNNCTENVNKILNLQSSSQILYHNCIEKVQDIITKNDILQDELYNTESINKANIIKYNEIKLKYQKITTRYEDANVLNSININNQNDTIRELNMYKELNLKKTNENSVLTQQLLVHMDKINKLNLSIFEKDDYLKNLQRKYVNEKPIIQIPEVVILPIPILTEPVIVPDEKMTFRRSIKISRR